MHKWHTCECTGQYWFDIKPRKQFVNKHNQLVVHAERNEIGLAVSGNNSKSEGFCECTIRLQDYDCEGVKLVLLVNLLADVILSQDFLKQHEQVRFNFDGSKPILNIGALECIKTSIVPRLFEYLSNDCKPIVMKTRRQSAVNEVYC